MLEMEWLGSSQVSDLEEQVRETSQGPKPEAQRDKYRAKCTCQGSLNTYRESRRILRSQISGSQGRGGNYQLKKNAKDSLGGWKTWSRNVNKGPTLWHIGSDNDIIHPRLRTAKNLVHLPLLFQVRIWIGNRVARTWTNTHLSTCFVGFRLTQP